MLSDSLNRNVLSCDVDPFVRVQNVRVIYGVRSRTEYIALTREIVSPPSFGVDTQAAAAVVGGRGRGDRISCLVGDMPQASSPAPNL